MTDAPASPRPIFVPVDRVSEARARLAKLAAKAERYGCGAVRVTEGAPIKCVRTIEGRGWCRKIRYMAVPMTLAPVEPVRLGAYRFVARIQDVNGSALICRAGENAPEVDPRFRETDFSCDHCGKVRARKDVFIVQDKSGAQIQVGRNCLADYLGVDPARVLACFSHVLSLNLDSEADHWGTGIGRFYEFTDYVLALANAAVRVFGWRPKTDCPEDEIPTARVVEMAFAGKPKDQGTEVREALAESDWETAKAAREWALAESPKSDYMRNLQTVLRGDVIGDVRHIGIAVSAIAAHAKAQDRARQYAARDKANAASQHVGKVGERLRAVPGYFVEKRDMGESAYGFSYLIKLRDTRGNVFSWFTTANVRLNAGEAVCFDGTVKAHKEFRGVRETQLTRVKIGS